MEWNNLSMSQRSELMQIYLRNGITSLDEMKKHYNSFAEGGFTSPDHDPNNPYHYHVNGKKVVVTPEDWEKYKDDPTFREVRAAVEAEQAAYPGPEYDEVENPAWRKAYQNLVNGINLKGRDNVSQPLPQGYTRDTKGVVMDEQGNYYLPVDTATNAPYFINQERGTMGHTVPVRYEQQQMPERTIRQLRQPLTVDRVLNVGEERENAINNYIANNFEPTIYKRKGADIYSSDQYVPGWTIWNGDNKIPRNALFIDGNGQALYLTGQKYMGEDAYEMAFEEEDPVGYNNLLQKYKGHIIKIPNPTGSLRYSLFDNPDYGTSDLTGARTDKILRKGKNPTNQEAAKNAVITIGDLEKVETFAKGGKLDIPPYWGQPTNKKDSPIDYLSRYVNSQAFARRAPNQSYIKQAKNAVNNFNGVTNSQWREHSIGPHINEYNNTITMYPGRIDTPYAPYENSFEAPYMAILAHEYGHLIDPNYGKENNVPKSYKDLYKTIIPEANSHDSRPDEIYADLQSLRYQLYENNIFDIINDGTFNESHLDKALKQGVTNRLLYTMPKETIIKMMNTIADSGSQDDAVNMVANGGPLMVLPLWQ